jgi:hypothetical protein
MTANEILRTVREVLVFAGWGDDGFADEIAEAIIDDNGTDLTPKEVVELTEQYLEEE